MPSSYETSSGPNLSEKPDLTAPNNAVPGDSSQTGSVDVEDVGEVFQQAQYRALGWKRTVIILMKLCFATGVLTIPSAFSAVGVGVTQVDRPAAAPQEGPYDMEVHSIGAPAFVPGVVATINLFGGTLEKIAYGISIPGFIMTTTLWVHLAAKFLLVRILRNSVHLQNKSFVHWATWL
ncbi:N amino acid transport system protein [Colletotrichum sp. SAR 10_77]|nr:N amino acid transport system protein [Colletotrichum sp. SAR 10_77]